MDEEEEKRITEKQHQSHLVRKNILKLKKKKGKVYRNWKRQIEREDKLDQKR